MNEFHKNLSTTTNNLFYYNVVTKGNSKKNMQNSFFTKSTNFGKIYFYVSENVITKACFVLYPTSTVILLRTLGAHPLNKNNEKSYYTLFI